MALYNSCFKKLKGRQLSFPVDLTTGLFMAVTGLIVVLLLDSEIKVSQRDVINGRIFPTVIALIILILSAFLIIKDVIKLFCGRPIAYKTINLDEELGALGIFVILVLTYLTALISGYFLLGALFCCTAFLLWFKVSRISYYLITLSSACLIWGAFYFFLDVRF